MKGTVLLLISLLSLSARAIELEPILFGPEFNISRSATATSIEALTERMVKHLVDGQPEGAKFTFSNKNEVGEPRNTMISPNGWWISWYSDSGVEFNAKPMTVSEFRHFKDDMQDAIFVSAANEGFFPQLWRGGGHINIDLTNFKKYPLFARNVLVDLFNHNELFMGIFNYDTNNAKPHEIASPANFPRIIREIDQEFINGNLTFELIKDKLFSLSSGRSIDFRNVSDNRLEIRAVRPQASMDVWVRQISLLEARMKYIATFDTLIPYKPRVPWNYDWTANELVPPIDPQAALRSFYVFVDEARQDWKDHRDYLWPQWMFRQKEDEPSELEKFESSAWFKVRQVRRSCEKFLGATGW